MRILTLLTACCLVPWHPATAQWRLALEHGSANAAGYSIDRSGPDPLAFLLDRPRSTVLAVSRDLGRQRLSLELRRTDADLALSGPGTVLVTRGAMHAWGAGFEAARQLAGQPDRPRLHAAVGALLERWDFDVGMSAPRTRLAGRAALEAEVPLTPHWSGLLRGELMVGSSIFTAEELPEGYTPRMGRRAGMVLGLARRW